MLSLKGSQIKSMQRFRCKLRGLKTQESEKFNRFWLLIQSTAAKQGCVFFGYAGEGRDFSTDDMEGEGFGGWLVPVGNADAFEALWQADEAALFQDKPLNSEFTFAVWNERNGHFSISFECYQ